MTNNSKKVFILITVIQKLKEYIDNYDYKKIEKQYVISYFSSKVEGLNSKKLLLSMYNDGFYLPNNYKEFFNENVYNLENYLNNTFSFEIKEIKHIKL